MTSDAREWEWTPERKLAAQLRAEGKTWAVVAKRIGYAEGSARNLILVPEFAERVDELSDAPVQEAQLVLKANARRAAETVVKIMNTGKAKQDEPRLAAAQDILDRMGITAAAQAPDPPPIVAVTVEIDLIQRAERAVIAVLAGQSAALGDALYAGEPSGSGSDPLLALPVPGDLPGGPQPGADRAQGAADGHESGRRA